MKFSKLFRRDYGIIRQALRDAISDRESYADTLRVPNSDLVEPGFRKAYERPIKLVKEYRRILN